MKFMHSVPCPLCGDTQELESDYPDTHIVSELCLKCQRTWKMGKRADAMSPMSEDDGGMLHLGIARGWNRCLKEIKGEG
jgi:hypothetical protein